MFDLHPDPSVPFAEVIVAARELRATFASAKLESFVKTAGGKGLHVCVPIVPELDWTRAKDFCRRVAEAMVSRHPDKYLAVASKSRRRGKIFVDYETQRTDPFARLSSRAKSLRSLLAEFEAER